MHVSTQIVTTWEHQIFIAFSYKFLIFYNCKVHNFYKIPNPWFLCQDQGKCKTTRQVTEKQSRVDNAAISLQYSASL